MTTSLIAEAPAEVAPPAGAAAPPGALPARPAQLYDPSCNKELAAWGVTRQFDFGQFVVLYHREAINGVEASAPVVVFPDGKLSRVVEDDEPAPAGGAGGGAGGGGGATPVRPVDLVRSGPRAFQDGQPPAHTLAGRLGGVPLNFALTQSNPLELLTGPPLEHVIDDLRDVLDGTLIPSGAGDLYPLLDEAAQAALLSGKAVETIAEHRTADGRTLRALVLLRPTVREVDLDEGAVDQVLSTGVVDLGGGAALDLERTGTLDAALRTGRQVSLTVQMGDGSLRHVRLKPAALPTSKPLAQVFTIGDPSAFLRDPYLPAVDGTPLRVDLTPQMVNDLRTTRTAQLNVNGTPVRLEIASGPEGAGARAGRQPASLAFDPTRLPRGLRTGVVGRESLIGPTTGFRELPSGVPLPGGDDPALPGGWLPPDTGLAGLTPDPDDGGGLPPGFTWPGDDPYEELHLDWRYLEWLEAYERLRDREHEFGVAGSEFLSPLAPPTKGLPVAVFLPWRQQWRFTGLSRGSLLSSIALAPGEERTLRMYSWERRSKALEQSTETETDMQQDYTSTTRDTEDVLSELTSNQKFNTQVHGEFDASYTPGVASIHVGAQFDASQEAGLQQVAKSSTQHLTETVHRASARVRSRRITKITESEESVRGEDVVRRIVNRNECHTLTLDYYEQLAHYAISTEFRGDRVRVVVMVDNPLRTTAFTNMTLRTNETALRQALLTPELGDGFAAARLLASYDNAWIEASRVAEESKKVAELDRERQKEKNPDPAVEKSPNPYLDAVLKAVGDAKTAAATILNADIGPALNAIAQHNQPPTDVVKSGQRWLWRRLAEAKLGAGITDALTALNLSGTPTIDDARRLKDPFGEAGTQELAQLAKLSDSEKEDKALAGPIHARMGASWDWAWWSGSCRDVGLYEPNDAGLVGAVTRMVDALGKYDAKASEGEALLAQQEMVNKGVEDQQAANWVDKLEMKYGLDVVADAQERQQALLQHLDEHADYYRYVLFQALPPGEQMKLLTTNAPQLRIGYFEPHVVAYQGDQLAIPLTPTGQTELADFVDDLAGTLKEAADQAQAAADQMVPDDIILPTPGLTVETSLGRCSGCEPHRRAMHEIERRDAAARARQGEAEADRREALLEAKPPVLDEFTTTADTIRLALRVEGAEANTGGPVPVAPPGTGVTSPPGAPPAPQ